jgi:hypothetical protein
LEKATRPAIMRHIENGQSLMQCVINGKLPLTASVLSNVAETDEEFVIQRIWRLRDKYLRELHILPSRYIFARQTGAREYLQSSPKIREAFNSAMQSLNDFYHPS